MDNDPKGKVPADDGKSVDLDKLKQFETDNFKQREEIRALKSQLTSFDAEKKALEEKRLKEANDWKQLAENYKTEAERTKDILNSYQEKEKETKKNTAILTELSRLGFDTTYTQEAFKLLDKSKVMIDEEIGRVYGADEVAKEFADKYQSFPWFKKSTMGVNHNGTVNNGRPNLDTSSMSRAELKEHFRKKLQTGR
jgi:superfamily II DNA helicase RecQ